MNRNFTHPEFQCIIQESRRGEIVSGVYLWHAIIYLFISYTFYPTKMVTSKATYKANEFFLKRQVPQKSKNGSLKLREICDITRDILRMLLCASYLFQSAQKRLKGGNLFSFPLPFLESMIPGKQTSQKQCTF